MKSEREAGNHGSWLWFYQNSRRLETERAKISVHVWPAEKNKTKQKKMTWLPRQSGRGVPSYSREGQHFLFYLNCQLIEKRSTHIREGNLLNSIDWFKCQPETPSKTHRNDIWPNACASHCSVKLIHKINHSKSSPCQLGMHTHLLKPSVIFK